MKTKWLGRRIACPGPYLALCLTPDEHKAASRELGLDSHPEFMKNAWSDATTHYIERAGDGALCALVCLRITPERKPIEIAGLLVHEAVHVWQEYADRIGEHHPGREQEAYAVQAIAQELMQAYADSLGDDR